MVEACGRWIVDVEGQKQKETTDTRHLQFNFKLKAKELFELDVDSNSK